MMLSWLWLIVMLPFAGFVVLAVLGKRLPRSVSAWIGVGSIGLAAAMALVIGAKFLANPPAGGFFVQTLWTWFDVGGLDVAISLRLDALSLVMVLVVTFVGFLIHLYSAEFMADDEGYSRFFAYMNLFVGSMLVLVLGENLLLLYLGWEGVGLCSYLLIGFWYREPENGSAARKAFVVTRIGDTALAIALFILVQQFGTLSISDILARAPDVFVLGGGLAVATAALLLGGAVGKSAQLPLQTWLPDAMAGPTPVSALIHAATMVTAGVYLIARTYVLFELAPVVQTAVAVIGAVTLLISGFSALAQRDIKRVLAYSTISQIGYMFLGLGVGAYTAAMFHFMTHAFFKALLFLGAGVLIMGLHHEHDMFRMGGMRKLQPTTFWTFLIGAGALSAVPLITAGFYSKDAILWYTWSSESGSQWLWGMALFGAFLTALYTFRMVFITFYGIPHVKPEWKPRWRMVVPLIVLAALSIFGGFINLPESMGHFTPFADVLQTVLPETPAEHASPSTELVLQVVAAAVVLFGIFLAYLLYLRSPQIAEEAARGGIGAEIHRFWRHGWGFDDVYNRLFVWPYYWIARVNRRDAVDFTYGAIAWFTRMLNFMFSLSQTGRVRTYAAGIAIGAVVIIAVMVWG